ncbi:uncharacterized N-acetyltransferase YitH-like [Centruroides vittatus]|uniref:uncharacterized N-acetyltransferase YitH-like n=1 Tax=Centruroides vittatus TaxID=120091 RepID=UPI00350EF373
MPILIPDYNVRNLRPEEIPLLLDLAKAEGRHMGLEAEIETWLEVDPECFFVACSDSGDILGSCCGVRLSEEHGYVGMYVVKPEYRSLGIGKKVWNAAIEHLGDRNKGLSAVDSYFPLYRDKAGFNVVADWTVDLYRSENAPEMDLDLADLYLDSKLRILPISDEELMRDVIAYDKEIHVYDRSKIVRLSLMERGCISRVALLGDSVCGYGCIKPGLQGLWIITPLYADSEHVAHLLLSELIGSLSEEEREKGFALKVPSTNTAAAGVMSHFGFCRQTYSLRRCYTHSVVDLPVSRIFALQTSVFCTE